MKKISISLLLITFLSTISCNSSGSSSNKGNSPAISNSKMITSFEIINTSSIGIIDEVAKSISVTVPYGTDVTSLVVKFTITGVMLNVNNVSQTSEVTQNNFTNSLQYVVTAEDGSIATYIVTVIINQSGLKEITGFVITGQTGVTISGSKIMVIMPIGTSISSLAPVITYTGASISPASGVSQNFTEPVAYTVTAENGSTLAYSVSIVFSDPYWTTEKGTEDDPYLIKTAEDLAHIATEVNKGSTYSGIFFKMANDIDLNSQLWTPIGKSSTYYFAGNFNGNGFSVKNLYSNTVLSYVGLFGYIKNASLKNISITGSAVINCTSSSICYIGAIAGYSISSVITNCHNEEAVNCTISGSNFPDCFVGGITGFAGSSTTIKDCSNAGILTGKASSSSTSTSSSPLNNVNCSIAYVGGITGYISSSVIISGCCNTGTITGSCSASDTTYYALSITGGITGYSVSSTLTKCYNTGVVSGTGSDMDCYAGGLIGYAASGTISDSYNMGSVTGTYKNTNGHSSSGVSCYVGGAAGGFKTGSLTNCHNSGVINGISAKFSCAVGGLVAETWSSTAFVNCYNTGSIKCNTPTTSAYCYIYGFVGGILGTISNATSCAVTFTNCYNSGSLDCIAQRCYVAGITGQDQSAAYYNCYSAGTITCTGTVRYEGGIVANITEPLVVNSYYSAESLTNPTVANTSGISKNDEYMKSSDFVSELNNGGSSWKQDSEHSNNGYPVYN